MVRVAGRPMLAVTVLGAIAVAGCGTGSEAPDTSTTAVVVTTTVAAPTNTSTTTSSVPQTPLEALGYPVSDDWVVETIVRELDGATGGLAVDQDGNLYQADFGYEGHIGDRVYRVAADGTIETFAHSDLMESLTMTTFGPDGLLYQSSYGSDRLFAIDAEGNVEVVAEGLRSPTGIVVLDDGTKYVESYSADTIYKVLPNGTVLDWVVDRRFNGLNGLTIGPDGTLYAVDHRDGQVFSIDGEGTVTKLHVFPAQTSHVVYSDDSLFITSRGSYVVFRYDLDEGTAEVIAGGGEAGERDGRGSEAAFGRPNAITIGPDGAFYVNHGTGRVNHPLGIVRISYQP